MSVTVYPVSDGAFLMGVPHAPLSVSAAVAKRLIKTGAYTAKKPTGAQPEPVELNDDARSVIDRLYDPIEAPPPTAEPTQIKAPQNAGPSDSTPEE